MENHGRVRTKKDLRSLAAPPVASLAFRSLVFITLLAIPRLGHACGNLNFNFGSSNLDLNAAAVSRVITVSRSSNTSGCSYFLAFSRGASPTFVHRKLALGAGTLDYNIYKESGLSTILYDTPDSSDPNAFISGTFPAGGAMSVTHTFWGFLFPVLGSPGAGQYEDEIQVRLFRGTVGSGTEERARALRFRYDQPKVTNISLVATGGAYNQNDTAENLSFGVLSTGQTLGMDVIVTHNAGYRLTMSSANNGNLKHQSLAQFVPYTVRVSGAPVNLTGSSSAPVEVATGSGVNASGARLPVSVTIGTVAGQAPGSYSDTIQMLVTSTE